MVSVILQLPSVVINAQLDRLAIGERSRQSFFVRVTPLTS